MILDAGLVLVAVDFTDEDWRQTVAHGAHHAQTRGVGVHLVNVVPKTAWLLRRVMDEASLNAHEAELQIGATRRLAEACESIVAQGIDATSEVRTGKPGAEILAAVKGNKAGLLVIGVGSPSTAAMLIGGTADRLLRTCPVPVLVRGPKAPGPLRRILVPTGMGPSGSAALDRAAHLVSETEGGTVFALHMVALPGVMRAYSGDVLKLRAQMEAHAHAELKSHVEAVGSDRIEPVLRTNNESLAADQTILREARERDVDLICLALGGRSLTSGPVIGRVSDRVIRALPCALLALPDSWIDGRKKA
ncbi:MAG: universal stress protein [Myxococcota bacterium]